ncbi:hypothetical protein [Paracoccus aerodenitrificans]|nr:hypothetical protein [Paracoccus aerodenitrificans]
MDQHLTPAATITLRPTTKNTLSALLRGIKEEIGAVVDQIFRSGFPG